MKISVCCKEDGGIYHIHSFDFYLDKGGTEEKILEQTKKLNDEAGYERFKTIEIPPELEEVISMLLGEKKYKRCKDIEDILDTLEEVDSTISNVSRDIYDASEAMEQAKKTIQELKEQMDEQNKKKA